MKFSNSIKYFLLMIGLIALISTNTFAHCDSVEGPVVKASQKALETGNINYVLVWVQAKDEKEIKEMFDKVNKVRALSPEAKALADMYFYETVVRIHRMGEGVGYTGLKPVGYEPEEGIEAADIAIEKNNVSDILAHLEESQHSKVKEYFTDLQSKRNYDVNDLQAGREYVESYVHFIHYVEGLFNGEGEHDQHNQEIHKH
ncbi:MAG: hypothetical protein IT276_00980 [Ignavibacteriaceae bacterium]|nr:hypothetical protein [Ignavibacterium sp.]MCC6253468.1 hypothetical protein [Ignavibacteriaceae bacterium]HMN22950.1 DUF6448 family protein [Ignavibacteriaceae bacterium]HRN26750.1 DUF6448 family protein [Ignavibacteriaceae bacterium]HRP92669.1 DUF6448 family protein [Ignavibacteriaceae bacterium]